MHVQNIKATTRPVSLGRLEGDPEPARPLESSQRSPPSYQVSDHKAAVTLGTSFNSSSNIKKKKSKHTIQLFLMQVTIFRNVLINNK